MKTIFGAFAMLAVAASLLTANPASAQDKKPMDKKPAGKMTGKKPTGKMTGKKPTGKMAPKKGMKSGDKMAPTGKMKK